MKISEVFGKLNEEQKEVIKQLSIKKSKENFNKTRYQGMVLAIEPMIVQGSYECDTLLNNWTVVTIDGLLAAHYENTVVINDGEPELLTL